MTTALPFEPGLAPTSIPKVTDRLPRSLMARALLPPSWPRTNEPLLVHVPVTAALLPSEADSTPSVVLALLSMFAPRTLIDCVPRVRPTQTVEKVWVPVTL